MTEWPNEVTGKLQILIKAITFVPLILIPHSPQKISIQMMMEYEVQSLI